jgi:hypothetical protein
MQIKLVRFKNPMGHTLPILADGNGEILGGQIKTRVINDAKGICTVRADFVLLSGAYNQASIHKGVIEALDEEGHL